MINKLTRFVTFAAIAALTTVGCARQVTPAAAPTPAGPPVIVQVKPVAPVRTWHLDNIPGWTLADTAKFDETNENPQVVAKFEAQVGEDLTVTALVVVSALDEESASTYLHDMFEAATTRDKSKVKILGLRNEKHGGVDALEVLELRVMSDGVGVLLSAALTDGKSGFFIVCGGNAEEGDAVLETCKPLVKSFRAGK